MKIIIATIKSYNIENALKLKKIYPTHQIEIITSKFDLTEENLRAIEPDYIFFPHWSWIIPENIYKRYRCIVFHTADLPYGRGGSPIQNLIIRGIYKTKISAIEVVEEIDAGDIYLKEDMDLEKGNINEIIKCISDKIFNNMIPEFLKRELKPYKQEGEILEFKRRKPEESNFYNFLTEKNDIDDKKIYDFIRMLDGEGYPKAYLEIGKYKMELKNIKLEVDGLSGEFKIKRK